MNFEQYTRAVYLCKLLHSLGVIDEPTFKKIGVDAFMSYLKHEKYVSEDYGN